MVVQTFDSKAVKNVWFSVDRIFIQPKVQQNALFQIKWFFIERTKKKDKNPVKWLIWVWNHMKTRPPKSDCRSFSRIRWIWSLDSEQIAGHHKQPLDLFGKFENDKLLQVWSSETVSSVKILPNPNSEIQADYKRRSISHCALCCVHCSDSFKLLEREEEK